MSQDTDNLLASLLIAASTNWGLSEKDIKEYIGKMGYHESKSNPSAIQKLNDGSHGRGRGILQYEIDEKKGFPEYNTVQGGAHTGINRLIDFNKKLGDKYDISFINKILPQQYDVSGDAYPENIHSGPNPKNLFDFSELDEQSQFIVFLADKLGDPTANMGKYDVDGDGKLSNRELAEFHADEHWAGYEGADINNPKNAYPNFLSKLTKKGMDERNAFIEKLVKDYQYYKP